MDFDGTLCENAWPNIGEPNNDLINWVKMRRESGDKLVLNTMRSGKLLSEAVKWCRNYGIIFDAVNDNIKEMKELYNNNPRKIYADIYIDDHNWKGEYATRLPYYVKHKPDIYKTLEVFTDKESDFDRTEKILLELNGKRFCKVFYAETIRKPKESFWTRHRRRFSERDNKFIYVCENCHSHQKKPTRHCPDCGYRMVSIRNSKNEPTEYWSEPKSDNECQAYVTGRIIEKNQNNSCINQTSC